MFHYPSNERIPHNTYDCTVLLTDRGSLNINFFFHFLTFFNITTNTKNLRLPCAFNRNFNENSTQIIEPSLHKVAELL